MFNYLTYIDIKVLKLKRKNDFVHILCVQYKAFSKGLSTFPPHTFL